MASFAFRSLKVLAGDACQLLWTPEAPLDWFFAHHKEEHQTEITQALQFASVEREVLLYQVQLRYPNLQLHFPVLRFTYKKESSINKTMASFAGAASSAAPDEKNSYRKDCVAPVKDTRVQTEVSFPEQSPYAHDEMNLTLGVPSNLFSLYLVIPHDLFVRPLHSSY